MLRTSSSHYEGCNRQWDVATKSFEGSEGKVSKVNCIKVKWQYSPAGLPVSMHEITGTEFSIQADLVLLSMGFTGVRKNSLISQFNIGLDKKGNISAKNHLCPGLKNVFAAGDALNGASLVVRALKSGKTAAEAINGYLNF
jgi:glutamate synthase (NADPH/NADH) small chain